MLTWLLSLAVAAAASPPLNVTLTNNLVGVTTVRVNGAGLRVEATLGADSSLFHARYREVHIADGRTSITRRGPRPHHAGTASGEADGEVFTDGRATATIEQGRLKSLVVRLPGKHLEVHDEDGTYARVRAPEQTFNWAEPKTFERLNNLGAAPDLPAVAAALRAAAGVVRLRRRARAGGPTGDPGPERSSCGGARVADAR